MSRALLLSPDDQAVTAITTVLEEMAVSCERPLDGVSAAQKLNSHNFDLVLVDCENLPAAKLIFDVCRRGKAGQSPVPIAIVDGRAGLPTAFRLGAELILTKPVSMDHARSTIRTAVGRLRREEPAHTAAPADNVASHVDAPQEQVAAAAAAAMSMPAPVPVAPQTIESTLSEVAPVDAAPAAEVPVPTLQASTAVKESPVPIPTAPAKTEAGFAFVPLPKRTLDPLPALKTEPEKKTTDDPVLPKFDDKEPAEVPSPAPVLSSLTVPRPSPAQPKSRGGQVAVLILLIVGGGAYAAWMYQPRFREMVQPQVERIMALVGKRPAAKPQMKASVPQPAAAKAATPGAPAAAPSDQVPANSANVAPPASDTATASAAVPANVLSKTASSVPESRPVAATPVSNEPAASAADSSNRTISLANPPEMDKNVVILSSKGAEKRLIAKVSPVFPAEAKASGIEGTVVLKVLVSDTGKVEKVSAFDGDPALAKAGIRAVKQWRYRPYVRDGKDLPFQSVVILNFQRK